MHVDCVKSYAHNIIGCYSDCLRGLVIRQNPLATVLFNMCSTVTVECCVLYLCCVGVFGMFSVM